MTGMLNTLGGDVQDLRSEFSSTSRAALASAKTVHKLREQVEDVASESREAAKRAERRQASAANRPIKPSTMVMGVGVLLLSWAMMFYLKTGNAHLALLGLVAVNLAGCVTIVLSKAEDY